MTALFRLSGRKFAVLLYIITASQLLVWFDKLSGSEWLTFNTLVFTGYIMANVWQKMNGAGKG